MDKAINPSNSECHTSASEHYRVHSVGRSDLLSCDLHKSAVPVYSEVAVDIVYTGYVGVCHMVLEYIQLKKLNYVA
jgi:hypothetical protein